MGPAYQVHQIYTTLIISYHIVSYHINLDCPDDDEAAQPGQQRGPPLPREASCAGGAVPAWRGGVPGMIMPYCRARASGYYHAANYHAGGTGRGGGSSSRSLASSPRAIYNINKLTLSSRARSSSSPVGVTPMPPTTDTICAPKKMAISKNDTDNMTNNGNDYSCRRRGADATRRRHDLRVRISKTTL